MKVIQGLYSGVTTVELDTLAAEITATLTTKHPDYAILAARIAVSNLHKETKKVFSGKYPLSSPPPQIIYKVPGKCLILLYVSCRCNGGFVQLCEST